MIRIHLLMLVWLAFPGILHAQVDTNTAVPAVDFGRDIRPILSNHCYQCHGVDEGTREADLRLDQRDAAIDYGAIVPGSPNESLLVERITTPDDSLKMPPASANKPLSDQQVKLLQQWIQQGANYEQHWAFQSVRPPLVPEDRSDDWCRNEIDAFVLHRLKLEQLSPSPGADRAMLIRRVYQDLLGLLPSVEEVDAFLADDHPDAYEHLVDRLLQSPHYGERWGRHWLDQARYADSHGYTIDGARIMWPYRDWVIAALNKDMPFDQFTIEQLAGDLLPAPTNSQLVATAFHRNTMINQEGGVKADQFRHEATIDRVNTTGAVWLGLTVACAQCHSHKFDPLKHEDYYRLYACFNGAVDANNTGPTVNVLQGEMFGWSDEQRVQLATLQQQRETLKRLEQQLKNASLTGIAWDWKPPVLESYVTASHAPLQLLEDGTLLASADVRENDSYTISIVPEVNATGEPQPLTAIRLRVLPHASLPQQGPGVAGNGNFVLTEFEVTFKGERVAIAQAGADHNQPDYDVSGAIDGQPKTGWAINVNGEQAKAGKKMNAPHEAVFVLAAPLETGGQPLEVTLRHDLNERYLVGCFALDVSTVVPPGADATQKAQAELASAKMRISELEAALPGKGEPVAQMVMRDQPQPPATFLLTRGDFLTPDRERGPLAPGVPEAVDRSGGMKIQNRLDLARWLVAKENPLTARVTVNRIWATYFGRGLVETENDFGLQGSTPSHPVLLDWLAFTFMDRGWSLKQLHRLIVTSAVYRQSSRITPQLMERDPRNNLLARQSRFRVEAEIVRDQALSASDLLSRDVGGPSVFPPQPDGIYDFTQNKKSWPASTGSSRYRRTMYTMFYRSAPHPLLSTFDAPDFSTVCTRRVRSNTPLQSLAVANGVIFIELARGLAQRTLNEQPQGTAEQRAGRMFRDCLTRETQPRELEVLVEFQQREQKRFAADPELARKFVDGKEASESVVELAAWTSVARLLFNTDEFVMRN